MRESKVTLKSILRYTNFGAQFVNLGISDKTLEFYDMIPLCLESHRIQYIIVSNLEHSY